MRLQEMLNGLRVQKDEEWVGGKKNNVKCNLPMMGNYILRPSWKRRRTRHSIVLCSQLAEGGWANELGSIVVTTVIVDHVVHNSYVIHIEGAELMRKHMDDIRLTAARRTKERRVLACLRSDPISKMRASVLRRAVERYTEKLRRSAPREMKLAPFLFFA